MSWQEGWTYQTLIMSFITKFLEIVRFDILFNILFLSIKFEILIQSLFERLTKCDWLLGKIYIHRSGRTARASAEGLTVLFVDPSERNAYNNLCNTLRNGADLPDFPIDGAYFANIKKRVRIAVELNNLLHSIQKVHVEFIFFVFNVVITDFTGSRSLLFLLSICFQNIKKKFKKNWLKKMAKEMDLDLSDSLYVVHF
jgi:hypothetical protein